MLLGAILVVIAYMGMAESHGTLRFFAYDRLSMRGKVVWMIGYGLTAVGLFILLLSAAASRA